MMRLFLILWLLLLPTAALAEAKTTIIHAGRLIDGSGNAPQNRVSVVIEGDNIKSVEPRFVEHSGAAIIDLSSKTVLAGLIDTHVHLAGGDYSSDAVRTMFVWDDFDDAVASTRHARETLLAGFTSVGDVGAPNSRTVLDLKSAINQGIVPGPRVFAAGTFLSPTGGHGGQASGLREGVDSLPAWKTGIVDGPESGRRAVRLMHRMGADMIKIMPSGGVLSVGDNPQALLMTDDEISAVVTTAHALGMKVADHAHGRDAIARAVELDLDSIEHGTFGEATTDALMKQKGVFLVPTLLVAEKLVERAKTAPETTAPSTAAKALEVAPRSAANLSRAYRNKVRIAFGSDVATPPVHGTNAQEFALMVRAGVTPSDAIKAATRDAAELLGQNGKIGTIAPGAFADLVVIKGDPLADIRKSGKVHAKACGRIDLRNEAAVGEARFSAKGESPCHDARSTAPLPKTQRASRL
jgi:imidazolonepropionase-like amidohydrolase